jgi:hypothetical protein
MIVVNSQTALSTAANTKTSDLVSGTYQFVGKGTISIAARGSATGMNITVLVGGVAMVNDQPIPYTGTAGALSIRDHVIAEQLMAGGRVEVYLRNTTGGALTTDLLVSFTPGR